MTDTGENLIPNDRASVSIMADAHGNLSSRRPMVRMAWRDLLFLHWPAEPECVRRLLPRGIELDTFDGSAWVGLVPFAMPRVRVFGLAAPGAGSVLECNVRTYVRCGDEKGVWFFTLDADSTAAVLSARLFWRLNYRRSDIAVSRTGDRFEYTVARLDHHRRSHLAQCYEISADEWDVQPLMRCVWEVGDAMPVPQPGDLEHFLTERYALYTLDRRGRTMCSRVRHDPWRLREARVLKLEQSLVAAAGVPMNALSMTQPVAFHADGMDTHASRLQRVRGS